MNIDKLVLRMAGTMVLLSLLLTFLFSKYWLILTALVGLNLFQSSFTGFCPAVALFKKFGAKPGNAFE